jgi:dimethylglycine dehydrogenase
MDAQHLRHVFLALETAGQPHGLGFYGAFAANSMRLEKGYRGWGADLTTERTPVESGLGFLVKPEGHDFTGRDALRARMADGAAWAMVLLEVETDGFDPFYSHAVHQGDHVVGIVTSGGYGHRTGKALALAYLRDPDRRSGLSVAILGRSCPAKVLDRPPFDPDNTRMKA